MRTVSRNALTAGQKTGDGRRGDGEVFVGKDIHTRTPASSSASTAA